jgi:hypothetical protein
VGDKEQRAHVILLAPIDPARVYHSPLTLLECLRMLSLSTIRSIYQKT